jgi:hypothetical protein
MTGDLRWWRRLGGAGALVAVAITLAACGGGPPGSSVASLGGSSTIASSNGGGDAGGAAGNSPGGGVTSSGGTQNRTTVLVGGKNSLPYAQCMQTHGVPDFPDPSASGEIDISSSSGIDPSSPAFQGASNDCRKYLPNGGKPPTGAELQKMENAMLAYSACMRANGVPTYPDPTFLNGGATVRLGGGGSNSGIDPNSPQFQHAQSACQKDLSELPGGKQPVVGGGPPGPCPATSAKRTTSGTYVQLDAYLSC